MSVTLVRRTFATFLLLALTAPAAAGAVLETREGPNAALADKSPQAPEKLDLNRATAEQLQEIPGLGETLAKRIVEFREEHGPFEKVDDLLNVRGIGVNSLEKLRPYLTVKPKSSAGAPR